MPEPNTFAGATLDRAAEHRADETWVAEARTSAGALALALDGRGVPLSACAEPRPVTVPLAAALEATGSDPSEAILLGVLEDGAPLFAVDADGAEEGTRSDLLGAGTEVVFLRDAAMRLSAADAGMLAYAQGLLAWQRAHRHCGRCGAETVGVEGGHARRCAVDATMNHPRTDPVVIAVVGDGDRLLLGRQPAWPKGRYSALAGFVEPGESLEGAVAREVDEEAGIAVGAVRYHSSQPWPFPGSLMMGFVAEYAGGEANTRDDELEDVGWFTRDEVRAATAEDSWDDGSDSAGLLLPPRIAIARRLIESWLDPDA